MASKQPKVSIAEFVTDGRPIRCPLALASFSEEQRAKVDLALKSAQVTGERIAQVLTGWGFGVSAQAVNRHRRGSCGCRRL